MLEKLLISVESDAVCPSKSATSGKHYPCKNSQGKRSWLFLFLLEKCHVLPDVNHLPDEPGFKPVTWKPKLPHPITCPIYAPPSPPHNQT